MRIEYETLREKMPGDWQTPSFYVDELGEKKHDYCLTIPVLNEGQRILNQLKKIQDTGIELDVIIADGGSDDEATNLEALKSLGVRSFVVKTGPGRMSAQMRCVFAYALMEGYKGVINIDGNDKDEVTDIFKHLNALKEGYDCVLPSRFIPGGGEENTPWERTVGIKYIHAPLVSLGAGMRMTDTTNSFRGYSREYLLDERVKPFRDIFVAYNLPYYLSIRAARLGYKVTEVPTTRRYPEGKVPTKIRGLRAKLGIMLELAQSVTGAYNP